MSKKSSWSTFDPQKPFLDRFRRLAARFASRGIGSINQVDSLSNWDRTNQSLDDMRVQDLARTLSFPSDHRVSRAKIPLKRSLEVQITTSFGRITRGRSRICTQSLRAALGDQKWVRNRKSKTWSAVSIFSKPRPARWCLPDVIMYKTSLVGTYSRVPRDISRSLDTSNVSESESGLGNEVCEGCFNFF